MTLLQLFARLLIPRSAIKNNYMTNDMYWIIARKQNVVKSEWRKALWISNNAMHDDSIVLILFQFFSHFLHVLKSQLKIWNVNQFVFVSLSAGRVTKRKTNPICKSFVAVCELNECAQTYKPNRTQHLIDTLPFVSACIYACQLYVCTLNAMNTLPFSFDEFSPIEK